MRKNKDLERLAGKALLDKEFRAKLIARPKEVAQEEGVSLTDQEAETLGSVDPAKADAWVASMETSVQAAGAGW